MKITLDVPASMDATSLILALKMAYEEVTGEQWLSRIKMETSKPQKTFKRRKRFKLSNKQLN